MTSPWGDALSQLAWAKIRPWLWLGAAVIAALVLWRAYALGSKHGQEECTRAHAQAAAEWERQNAKDARKADKQDQNRLSTYEGKAAPIRERIIERVQVVPADCVDAGLRGLLNAQIAAGNGDTPAAPAKGR